MKKHSPVPIIGKRNRLKLAKARLDFFFATRRMGIAILGVGGSVLMCALSVGMHANRELFEPLLEMLLRYFVGRRTRAHYNYDPSNYDFWAWLPLVLAVCWLAISLVEWIKRPAQDRHVEKVLRNKLDPSSSGEKLEPE